MKISTVSKSSRSKQEEFLRNFIAAHKIAVIATVTGNALPEAAVIGIGVTKDLEIICSSFITSRKYKNLKANPSVALVIGWDKGKTVQYEGVAEEFDVDSAEEDPIRTILAGAPSVGKYINREHKVFYRIKPKWIRYSDLSIEPWDRFEIKF